MIKEISRIGSGWRQGWAKSITFIVTKDCQLACKYCYLVGKNTKERMSWEVAKEAIDYILDREEEFREESVIWDFIGGEPFLEIDLIDQICDYIKIELFRRNHHWFNAYRFSFSTNGINYHTEKVQQFIVKNRNHLSIGITIDGTKRKHDLNRIWKTAEMEQGIQPKPEDEKGSLRGAIVPYLLGISKYNPLEKEWYDGSLLDSEQIKLPLQVDIFYDNEVRNRVVDWVKARYQGMTTRLGQPALKLQHCTVVFRRVVKS